MTRIKVKYIGPIKEGYNLNNGFIDINEITIFIGNQGTGKSTIAKVFSTMAWIEKALVRGDFKAKYISMYSRFKKQLEYQNIHNYLTKKTLIDYDGEAYRILYKEEKLLITKKEKNKNYSFPKIMYVPAERNFVSSVDSPGLIKKLPLPLYTFLDEYEAAKQNNTGGIKLPLGNVIFKYSSQHKKSWLIDTDDNYKIELLEASSGFQSLVPLFLVTQYLMETVTNNKSTTHSTISIAEKNRIEKEIAEIKNGDYSDLMKRALLKELDAKFTYSCFVNIVEEPEQNLYPSSQKNILFELLASQNKIENNKLLITTHSPYIINYLTLALKAFAVKSKVKGQPEALEALAKIVPLNATINSSNLNIYELTNSGTIQKLEKYNGLPSDENYLNSSLAETNDLFIDLLKIQKKWQ